MKKTVILLILFILFSIPILSQTKIPSDYIVRTFIDEEGNSIDEIIVPGRPPADHREPAVELPDPAFSDEINILTNVPAFDWSYGCSATSGAMIAGYYDNGTYPNMYTGPANGGVVPLNNSIWGSGECPLSATHQGYDGLSVRGHVDDYWSSYGSTTDPYYGYWTEHGYADCTADYMGTNQYYNWQNTDGSTTFYYYTNGSPIYNYTGCEPAQKDGCHGLKEFFESRGYSIQANGNYSQYIQGYNGNTQGFTFNQFKAEIDSGRPVMIQVAGHTMVGIGYDDSTNLVYIHDTWDYSNHSMTWGGSYSGMQHYGMSVFILEPVTDNIINGYAYLENQTNHSGIEVLFERTAPSTYNESTYTDSTGYFILGLHDGLYDITYSKDEYHSEFLTGQSLYTNTTLSDITLLEHSTILNVPSVFSTIQSAINYSFEGDTVLVQPGTYVENINFNGKNITIASLFITTQDTSYISQTIIDGNQSGSVVTFNNNETSDALLIGFTIENGLAVDGGGVYCYQADPTIQNLKIVNNQADNGGGIRASSSNLIIENSIIALNSAANGGGGIYIGAGNQIGIIGCEISNNIANSKGSAMFIGTGYQGTLNINLINSSVCFNAPNGYGRGVISLEEHGNAIIMLISNSIMWNNANLEISLAYGSYSSIVLQYSVIQNGENSIYGDITFGNNVSEFDPLFVDILNQNYSIQSTSQCIDAGLNNDLLPDFDLLGNPRVNFGIVDIGAYEFQQSGDFIVCYSPNGNENYQINTEELITWSSNIQDLVIDFSSDNGVSWYTVIDSTFYEQQYLWTVPNVISQDCKIRISDSTNLLLFDESDDRFSIWTKVVTNGELVSGTWTVDLSPVIITGQAIVPEDSTLTIDPGVTVNFLTGTSFDYNGANCGWLKVLGTMIAEGTVSDSIHFTRLGDNSYWGTILYYLSESNTMNYCSVSYANTIDNFIYYFWDMRGGLSSNMSSIDINYSSFSNCNQGGLFVSSGSGGISHLMPKIKYCSFFENDIGIISKKTFGNNPDTLLAYCEIYNNRIGIHGDGGGSNQGIFTNNLIYNNEEYGLLMNDASLTILENSIYNNGASGISMDEQSSVIYRNNIFDNNGHGIIYRWCSPKICNNYIYNNSNCGIYSYGGFEYSKIYSNLISNNNDNGITCINNARDWIGNNTIVNNSDSGIYSSSSQPSVESSIIYNNNNDFAGSGIIYLSNSMISSEFLPNCVIDLGENSLNLDPQFVDEINLDFQLLSSSPAIDNGKRQPTYSDSLDLSGNPRINHGRIDIGAYEYQQAGDWLWVTSPSGGEFIESGSSFPITWIRSDSSSTVTIEFYNGSNWSTIDNSASNSGEYNDWIVQEIDSDSCRIKIIDNMNPTICDSNDEYFSIKGNIIEHNEEISGTWTLDNSPYTVEGKAIIPEGSTLTIEAGVEVVFKTGNVYIGNSDYFDIGLLYVNGKLEVLGTSENPVIFTRNGNYGNWGVIYFHSTADTTSVIKYANIEYANVFQRSDYSYAMWGAISFYNSGATIKNTEISNSFYGFDCSENVVSKLINNTISNNYAGMICYQSDDVRINNNLIYNNLTVGIDCQYSSPNITNNTISSSFNTRGRDNWNEYKIISEESTGKQLPANNRNLVYGISCTNGSDAIIKNNLLWGNGLLEDGATFNISGSSPTISYTLIEDETFPFGAIDEGYNILDADPFFIDPANGNFQIQFYSPCINSGTPDTTGLNLPEIDLAGNPRIFNGEIDIIDMGAYEYQGEPLQIDFSADVTSGNAPLSVQFTALNNYPADSYEWDFNNDEIVDATGENASWGFPAGIYPITLYSIYGSDAFSETKSDYITSINQPPYIENPVTALSFDEDTIDNSLDLNYIFSDVNGDSLSFDFSGNINISVSIDDNGIVTLEPSENWNGEETITFSADDGYQAREWTNDKTNIPKKSDLSRNQKNLSAKSRNSSVRDITSIDIEITVNPINDAPILEITGTFEADEDLPSQTYDFTSFCTQVWGETDVLTLTADNSDHINVTITDFDVVFESNTPNWFGIEEVIFYLDDNVSDSIVRNTNPSKDNRRNLISSKQKEGSRDIVSQTISVTINPFNDAPILEITGTFEADEDLTSQTYDFTNFCTQAWGEIDVLTLTADNSDHIDVTITNFDVIFESNTLNWNGTEDITFYLDDNVADSRSSRDIVEQTIQVTVNPVNDPPTIVLPDYFTFAEDSTLIGDFAPYVNDIDGDDLTLSVTGNTEITIDIAGTIVTFGATVNWNGTETLIFTVDDNQTRATASDSVDVIVTPVNDPPTIILPDVFTFAEDSTLVEDFAVYIDDIDPDELTLSVTGNTEITVDIAGTIVTFGATENWNGTELLTFTVDDNQTRATASDSVDVIVIPINDPPTIILPDDFTFAEDSTLVEDFSVYIDDIDPDVLTLSVTGNTEITVDIAGIIVTFGATENWNGTETLIFTVDDNQTRATASDSVDVIVTPVNDPPTIVLPDDFTFVEDSTLVEDFAVYIDDVDPDVLTLSVTGNTEITVDIAGTVVTFGASENWNGTENLTFTVDDNQTRATASDSVDVIVTPVNDPPLLIGFIPEELEFTVYQDSIVTFNVEVEDIDSELNYAWFVNTYIQTEISDTFIYQFSELGEFEIKSEVSDEEYQIDTIWDVTVEEQVGSEILIPAVTELRGNYPNPFNPETTISFGLKSYSDVLLQIYNIKGQLVETLINENKHAGYHNIDWNAKDMSSGIYLYKFNVNGKTEAVKKCLLLK